MQRFPGAKCWISFQCNNGATTARREPFDDAVRQLLAHPAASAKLVAVGANCVSPLDVTPLLKLANSVNNYETWKDSLVYKKVPYVVYPNSGEDWDAVNKSWTGKSVSVI